MRLSFMGTPAFALPSLRELMRAGHEICLVITQPDRPAGRGRRVAPPPVKLAAEKLGLPILQPEKVRDPAVLDALRAARPEVVIVVAYGQLLPDTLLAFPPHGCLNVHASLLPKYRGPAPIPWSIIRDEPVTGVTIMRVETRLDAGPILLQQAEPIRPRDTAGTLGDRLAVLGATLVCKALDQLERGRARAVPQDEHLATYARKLTPEDARIDWTRCAREVDCLIRGLLPEPGAVTRFNNRRVKILEASVESAPSAPPGTVMAVDDAEGVLVATGQDGLRLTQVQPENRRVMTAAEFARGYRVRQGDLFGPG